jgi:hypothetical protein
MSSRWNEEDLTLLLGLFYFLPFADGDDNSEVNAKIAEALSRTRGSVDMQWRNTQYVVRERGERSGISQVLSRVVKEHRTAPWTAIKKAHVIASARSVELSVLLPDPDALDSGAFAQSCTRGLCDELDLVLFQIVWRNPQLVCLRVDMVQADWKYLAARLGRSTAYTRNRARTIYAVLNGAEGRDKCLNDASAELRWITTADRAEVGAWAIERCAHNGWCIWNYL